MTQTEKMKQQMAKKQNGEVAKIKPKTNTQINLVTDV